MLRREARKRAYKKEVRSSAQGGIGLISHTTWNRATLKVGWACGQPIPLPLVSLWRKVLGPESGCCGQKRKARYRALRLVVGMAQRREGAIEYGEGRLGAFYAAFWHVNVGCRAAEPSDGLRGTGLLPLEPGGRLRCAASYGCCKPWEGQGLRTRLINGHPEGPVDGAGSATCTAPRGESKGIRVCDKAREGETPVNGCNAKARICRSGLQLGARERRLR